MLKFKYIITLLLAQAIIAVSCSDKEKTDTSFDYASTQVLSFQLQPNSKILPSLDSVFFSIDLVGARIFNADSLPKGTKIDRLQVVVTTDNCSAVEFHIPRPGQSDSIMNYLTNSTDSIDFSNGPVKLHLVSMDRVATRDYMIYVNVHKMINDSLQWDFNTMTEMPGYESGRTESNTVLFNDRYLTLVSGGDATPTLYSQSHPTSAAEEVALSINFTPRVETLTAAGDNLYVLSEDGSLYKSTDGKVWSPTSQIWESITAGYGSKAVGVTKGTDGKLYHATYPGTTGALIDKDFPVGGNSQSIRYVSEWSPTAQVMIAGGHNSEGKAVSGTWAYDGSSWGCISNKLPAIDGLTMAPYYVTLTDSTTWVVSDRSVFLVWGGTDADGKAQGSVYISYDLGFNWQLAPAHVQLPERFPPLTGSKAFIVSQTNFARAIRPITEWDTPYIYMYQGHHVTGGRQGDWILRGVLNNLEFKPLQ